MPLCHCASSVDVLIADKREILTFDSAHRFFVARTIRRKSPLVLIL